MKNDPIESALALLDDIPLHTPEGRAEFGKALASKSNLVSAKAARIVGSAQWSECTDEMVTAFDRFLTKGAVADKACAAMIAIARSLVQLDFDSAQLFLRGMKHVQMEASYGPPIDTAVELRAICAMGLANSRYAHKMRDLVVLLTDKEWQARVGAIRAMAVVGSDSASLLLRYKMLSGDREAEVMGECFTAIIALEAGEGVAIVTPFARSGTPEIRDAALLSLGASRRADAVEWLTGEFAHAASLALKKCILLSLSTSRTDAALGFLLHLVRGGSSSESSLAAAALSIHHRDSQLSADISAALAARADV